MPTSQTVYKDKDSKQVNFEISSDLGSNVILTMDKGAVTVIMNSSCSTGEYRESDSPVFLKKDKYSMMVGKTAAVIGPKDPPSVTITIPISQTVYKDKYPELVEFEISPENGANVSLTMDGGAVTVIISSSSSLNEYRERESPVFFKKGKYSMKVGKTTAVTDPTNPPSVTITF